MSCHTPQVSVRQKRIPFYTANRTCCRPFKRITLYLLQNAPGVDLVREPFSKQRFRVRGQQHHEGGVDELGDEQLYAQLPLVDRYANRSLELLQSPVVVANGNDRILMNLKFARRN